MWRQVLSRVEMDESSGSIGDIKATTNGYGESVNGCGNLSDGMRLVFSERPAGKIGDFLSVLGIVGVCLYAFSIALGMEPSEMNIWSRLGFFLPVLAALFLIVAVRAGLLQRRVIIIDEHQVIFRDRLPPKRIERDAISGVSLAPNGRSCRIHLTDGPTIRVELWRWPDSGQPLKDALAEMG